MVILKETIVFIYAWKTQGVCDRKFRTQLLRNSFPLCTCYVCPMLQQENLGADSLAFLGTFCWEESVSLVKLNFNGYGGNSDDWDNTIVGLGKTTDDSNVNTQPPKLWWLALVLWLFCSISVLENAWRHFLPCRQAMEGKEIQQTLVNKRCRPAA